MLVLGIDPGTLRTGYGVINFQGGRLAVRDFGVIAPPAAAALEQRLQYIFQQLTQVIARHRPEALAVEGVFTHRNAASALKLGHARGVALLAAAEAGLKVWEYSPALVKKSFTGSGAADKEQMRFMAAKLFGLPKLPPADAADALAVALCHCHNHPSGLRISTP